MLFYLLYYLDFPTIETITLPSSATAVIKISQSICCKNKTIESYPDLCKDNNNLLGVSIKNANHKQFTYDAFPWYKNKKSLLPTKKKHL